MILRTEKRRVEKERDILSEQLSEQMSQRSEVSPQTKEDKKSFEEKFQESMERSRQKNHVICNSEQRPRHKRVISRDSISFSNPEVETSTQEIQTGWELMPQPPPPPIQFIQETQTELEEPLQKWPKFTQTLHSGEIPEEKKEEDPIGSLFSMPPVAETKECDIQTDPLPEPEPQQMSNGEAQNAIANMFAGGDEMMMGRNTQLSSIPDASQFITMAQDPRADEFSTFNTDDLKPPDVITVLSSYAKALGPQKGVLFDNAHMQLGYVTEVSDASLKVSLFFGNKLGEPILNLGLRLAKELHGKLKIKSRPEQLGGLMIEAGQQLLIEFLVEVGGFTYDPPSLEFCYFLGEKSSPVESFDLPLPTLRACANLSMNTEEVQFKFPQKESKCTALVTSVVNKKALVYADLEPLGYDCKLMLKGSALPLVQGLEPVQMPQLDNLFS